jgi:ATP-dependent DNA ligase
MKLSTLYSKTKSDQIQVWEIYVEGDSFYTREGILNGAMTESKPTKCFSKNEGKKNATTAEEQALKEAQAKHKKRLDRDYRESIEELEHGVFQEPMLAEKYKDYISKKGDLFELNNYVYVSPKLDGMRCLVGQAGMKSREGRDVVSATHVHEALIDIIEEMNLLLYGGNMEIEVDGEIYTHKLNSDFNKIISLAKKTKLTERDLRESREKLEYHIYDIRGLPNNPNYTERFSIISDIVNKCNERGDVFIKLVEAIKTDSSEFLESKFGEYLEKGYEGLMVRMDVPYESKRTWNLLKYKSFIDGEFPIKDVLEGKGNRAGIAAKILCEYEGREFEANLRGNEKFRKEFLENKSDYIGLSATIKYQNITPLKEDGTGGVPRIGVMIKLRGLDGSDLPINL